MPEASYTDIIGEKPWYELSQLVRMVHNGTNTPSIYILNRRASNTIEQPGAMQQPR